MKNDRLKSEKLTEETGISLIKYLRLILS